jgi:dihydrofolate reductase
MAKLRVHNVSVSLDGFAAGPRQSRDEPLGVGGENLHTWFWNTRYGRQMLGQDGGADDLDNQFLLRGDDNIGATIMGRNMFGPIRGEWGSEDWRGWWGDTPPYRHPVFVLTHYPHQPIEMLGGTTFYFVTDGIDSALRRAFEAADGQDVRIGGGASTIQQYLRAGLVDDVHVAISPILLGGGERLFEHLDGAVDGYRCVELTASPAVVHVRLENSGVK